MEKWGENIQIFLIDMNQRLIEEPLSVYFERAENCEAKSTLWRQAPPTWEILLRKEEVVQNGLKKTGNERRDN